MKNPDFLHVDSNSCWFKFIEIKSWMKSIGVDAVINGCAYSGRRTPKLWMFLTKKLTEWAGFWCVDINSGKLQVTLIIGPLSYGG